MATTVHMAFEEFFQNINLDREDRNLVTEHHTLREKLRSIFALDAQPSDFLSGSYARNTIIKPPHDVDFFICFDNKNEGNKEEKANGASSFHEYVINTIRGNREIFGEKWRITSQTRSINIRQVGSTFGFDIVPSFPSKSYFIIADRDYDEWIETNPRKFDDLMTKKNQQLGSWLKRLIKVLKAWNNYKNKPLKSFFIEVLLYNIVKRQPQSYPSAVTEIFEALSSIIYDPIEDPALPDTQIDYFFDDTARGQAEEKLTEASEYAKQALTYEEKGEHQEAIRIWRRVFGREFPEPIDTQPKRTGSSGTPQKKRSRVSRTARDLKFG